MSIKSTVPECDRVGIWLFHSDYSAMFSLMCVDEFGKQSKGEHLLESDYKNYFSHIVENDFLVACDARNDEVAKCFNHGYFDEHNVHSLLDVTFNKDFVPLGIICCERTGNKTEWQPQDIKTLKSIAVKASLFISHNISDMYASKPQ
ncbi:GAF domain-containing protein [Colwellia sp. MB02u-18]|uniref:GAF domain-containing protein n=1 Tax=unclassified Colwellia TaxID=196834 RepID=UPI0015F39C1A|nr:MULTISPECIES: GAF domain-containing protein [unclassified Colwellia]MBA6225312.1 GAF domain-containing protein [Colwellia sp. MB3u-45]MBA6267238.1 GAF domain-containing protein [Colwellia sp. MB3u-43]MBA6322850.1 GAF domain-containing protein [Colwellia sp. MB02u-19]MBA6324742.1 GAF domain-containing protein [Colwellia sp. MB02u-18]MBA6331067.1 GAF domain-containing protein [Colwellia sp. MB02u-12]